MQSMAMPSNDIWIQDSDEKRKLEGQELIDYQANIDLVIAEVEARKTVEKEKEIIKTTAEAKLAALGLTTDDLKALGLGTN